MTRRLSQSTMMGCDANRDVFMTGAGEAWSRRRGGFTAREGAGELSYYTGIMPSLAAALLAFLLCVPSAAAAERVIVAFGDSLTAGLGVTPENSYPARLQAKVRAEGYDYRVVNAGASGDTTAGGT
jgi:Lysophospholipase L1 and related esterases